MTAEIEYNGVVLPVKYKHVRKHYFDEDGCNISPKGGKTLAVLKLDRFSNIVAFAECSKKDTYSRKVGRKMAFERLEALLARLTPAKEE